MKKLLTLTLMLLLILGFSVCQAFVPRDRMTAGSVYLDQEMTNVIAIYGRPVSIETESGRIPFPHTIHHCKYGQFGTTFDVIVAVKFGQKAVEPGSVAAIKVSGNNGISTKDGIKVGTPINEVKRILGKPDGETKERLSYYEFLNDASYSMHFDVKNGVVASYWILNDIIRNISSNLMKDMNS